MGIFEAYPLFGRQHREHIMVFGNNCRHDPESTDTGRYKKRRCRWESKAEIRKQEAKSYLEKRDIDITKQPVHRGHL